jgi:hypothetical protein
MIEFLDLTSGLAGSSDHALPMPAVMATENAAPVVFVVDGLSESQGDAGGAVLLAFRASVPRSGAVK